MARSVKTIQDELSKWSTNLIQQSTEKVPNGCILNLAIKYKTPSERYQEFNHLLGYESDKAVFRWQVDRVLKEYNNVKKGLRHDNHWERFLKMLETEVNITPSGESVLPSKRKPTPSQPPIEAETSKKIRRDCDRCLYMQNKVSDLESEKGKLQEKLQVMEKELADEKEKVAVTSEGNMKMMTECKKWKAKVGRKTKLIKKLRSVKNSYWAQLKRRKGDPCLLIKKLKNEKIRTTALKKKINKLEGIAKEMKSEERKLKGEVRNLEIYIDDVTCSAVEKDDMEGREGTPARYDPKIRRVIYEVLHSKVPLANAEALISCSLRKLGNVSAPKLPSKSTISRMSTEISVLTIIQAAETLLQTDSATLAWDATTLDGQHINEVHIQTPKETLTLSIAVLPGGRAIDYVTHITAVIDQMTKIYSCHSGLDPVQLKQEIIQRIKSTMSDRASVNTCVVRELRQLWQSDLVELHCNLHPLDTFASQIRSGLRSIDSDWDMRKTGRDCCAANFLYSLSKLRIKETGDPAGFTAFLRKHGIPPSDILRYVGNKWNVLFKMSATVLKHQGLLQEYLDKYCRNESALRTDLLWAVTNEKLLTQLRALALVGKVITTPWMKEFYGNKGKLSNLQMVPKLQSFSSNLKVIVTDPSLLLSSTTDIFGGKLEQDATLLWMQDSLPSEDLITCLRMMVTTINRVCAKQLARYLTGELSKVTPELLEATKASTPHNVWAERVLGMLNAFWDRGKQATIEFLESRVKAGTNNTMAWLDSKEKKDQESLIKFAMKTGGRVRKEEMQRRGDLRKETDGSWTEKR